MNAEEFVQKLTEIPISLEGCNLSEIEMQELIDNYTIKKHPSSSQIENPLFDFVTNYYASNLEIGMITFDDELLKGDDYIFFGKFEIDDLAVNKNLGTIVMLENGTDHVLYKCANNGANFLDAIAVAAGFLEKRAIDDNLYENQGLNLKIAEECGEIAGSKQDYQDFYKMMFGV